MPATLSALPARGQLVRLRTRHWLVDDFEPMNRMCERAGLSERAVYDRTKAVMEFFGFPFEEPPPRWPVRCPSDLR